MALTPARARQFYNRLGRGQDLRAFYADRTVGELLASGRLGQAQAEFEFSCATGRPPPARQVPSGRCPRRTSWSVGPPTCHQVRGELQQMLRQRFGLDHTTLQVDNAPDELLTIGDASS